MPFFGRAILVLITVALCHILRFGMEQELTYTALLRCEMDRHATTVPLGPKYPHHAIVIPYRDRLDNAKNCITYMGSYLTRNFPNETFSVYFVVQVDSGLFSRGFLLNVGLNEIKKARPETQCVTMHDIDLLPVVDGVPYNDCTYPIQLSSEIEHFNWGVPYDGSCGGVISLHMNDWLKVNVMSNDYEGWGGEDDDLYFRLQRTGLLNGPKKRVVLRPPRGKGRFSNHENVSTISNENRHKAEHAKYSSNLKILGKMTSGSHRWQTDGLNDVAYLLIDRVDLDVPKGAMGVNVFDEVHIVKVTGRDNHCLGPNINVTARCIRGTNGKGSSSHLTLRQRRSARAHYSSAKSL